MSGTGWPYAQRTPDLTRKPGLHPRLDELTEGRERRPHAWPLSTETLLACGKPHCASELRYAGLPRATTIRACIRHANMP